MKRSANSVLMARRARAILLGTEMEIMSDSCLVEMSSAWSLDKTRWANIEKRSSVFVSNYSSHLLVVLNTDSVRLCSLQAPPLPAASGQQAVNRATGSPHAAPLEQTVNSVTDLAVSERGLDTTFYLQNMIHLHFTAGTCNMKWTRNDLVQLRFDTDGWGWLKLLSEQFEWKLRAELLLIPRWSTRLRMGLHMM